jgi:hypothetical protein
MPRCLYGLSAVSVQSVRQHHRVLALARATYSLSWNSPQIRCCVIIVAAQSRRRRSSRLPCLSAPGPAAEIARNSSRCDARVRAHVPGSAHRAVTRNATREGTRGAGDLNDPISYLYCASVSGLTRSGFCPKHSAPHAVEFARRICARHSGNQRRDARTRDQQTSGMISHVKPLFRLWPSRS